MAAGHDELIRVRTGSVTVTIKGNADYRPFGSSSAEKEASVHITCDDEFQAVLAGDAECCEIISLNWGRTERYQLLPLFFEQQQYEIIIEADQGRTVEFWHESPLIRSAVTAVGSRKDLLTGIINFKGDIGLSDFVIFLDSRRYLKLTVEVFPSKIDYKEDYRAIVADVTAEVYNLAFDFLKRTYENFDLTDRQRASPVEFFAILRNIFDRFLSAADMVLHHPHHQLEKTYAVRPGRKIRQTDAKTIRWVARHPEQVQRSDDRILVNRALSAEKRIAYDTQENRLTKYMLVSTVYRLETFQRQYGKLKHEPDDQVLTQIDTMIREMKRRCDTGILKEIQAEAADSGMSLVFRMAPGYREMYRFYLMLKCGLSVTGGIFQVSVKDLAVLYEYWCFIKLNSIMKERYQLISQDIVRVSGNGLFVSLIKGKSSSVRYLDPDTGEYITLSYNPKIIGQPTVTQRPDNVLRLEKKGAEVTYEYVFDAKYRIDTAANGTVYQQNYGKPGPKEDDINTMHRYRDAIVYANDASPYERTMFGAYVLFPYRNEAEYEEHHFCKSIEQVNIGGLPFLPTATGLVTRLLDELVADSPASAFERATLPKGIEDRLAKVDWQQRDVLIGLVNDEDQRRRCMGRKFYYTYVNSISDSSLPVQYVALYEKGKGIEYYGRVATTQKVPRSRISVGGRNPNSKCYLFEVKEWIRLPHVIRSEAYGPRPVSYTNHFLLMHSDTYPELHLRSEEEYRFFTELKRLSGQAVVEEDRDSLGFELNGTRVLFREDQILVIRNRRIMDQCSVGEFSRRPSTTFRRLQRSLQSEATKPPAAVQC